METTPKPGLIDAVKISCAYCVQAINAQDAGFYNRAWTFVIDARYWLGIAIGAKSQKKNMADVKQLFSDMGKLGSAKRHKPMAILEKWAIDKYRESPSGKWSSANEAAHDLMVEVMAYGRTIGAHLKKSNAQRTIAGWINVWKNKSV